MCNVIFDTRFSILDIRSSKQAVNLCAHCGSVAS
jgi:hypothetical protein